MSFSRKYTGTQYAPTVAALVCGCIYTPALVYATRPYGDIRLTSALAFFICLYTAWLSLRQAELTIPTLHAPIERG